MANFAPRSKSNIYEARADYVNLRVVAKSWHGTAGACGIGVRISVRYGNIAVLKLSFSLFSGGLLN
jgi:hypothetical protein